MPRRLPGILLATLFLVIGTASSPARAAEPLVLAVHPYLPAAEITRRFTPIAEELVKAIGRNVRVRVGRDYAEHIEAIGADVVDIAYMGPAPYVTLVERFGRKPLLGRQEVGGQPWLKGEIVVRQDSALTALAGLKGKRFAFGDANSTMSHVVPARMLAAAGVDPRELGDMGFLGSHRNVALAVLAGDFDAGAVKQEVFREFEGRGLRSIATAPAVADHLFVASARLPADVVATLRRVMLGLRDSPRGRQVLGSIHSDMTAIVPARDEDYDPLRALLIERRR